MVIESTTTATIAARSNTSSGWWCTATLVATLLMELLHRGWHQLRVRRFELRAVSPLFDGRPLSLRARRDGDSRIALWAVDEAGLLTMSARAEVTWPRGL